MNKQQELWLEFGYMHADGFHDMCWYNEGRASQIIYFLCWVWKIRKRRGMYAFWRYGKKNHYLIKRSL